jgi:hypothetical protein
MKNYALAGLIAFQTIIAAQPAAAASLEEATTVRSGTFAGARMRLSLGGPQTDRKFRAGLTLAPTLRSESTSGETRTRFGEGVELGFTGKRPLTFSISGQPVSRLLPGGRKSEDERRLGVSTAGYVAIGVGVAALVGVFVLYQDVKDGSLSDCCE